MRTSTRSHSILHRVGAAVTASIFAVGTFAAHPSIARADENVSPHGKGIVGGALLGAEVVTIVESIAGVHNGWAYVIGAVLGAGAGGAGGYAVEQNSTDGKAPVYMLVGGLGLVIPALVLSLNATRYMPSETAVEDRAPTNGPVANPGSPGASAVTSPAAPAATPAPPPAAAPPPPNTTTPTPGGGGATPPLSLLDMSGGAMRIGVPIPEVRQVFSATEVRQYGVAQQTEVRMPLVKVTF